MLTGKKRKEESEGDVLCKQSNELNNHENLVFLALIHYAFCLMHITLWRAQTSCTDVRFLFSDMLKNHNMRFEIF